MAHGSAAGLRALISEQSDVVALELARACWVEAGFRHADCTAIAFVVHRRAELTGRAWLDMLLAYSVVDGNGARARLARTFPAGDVSGASAAVNAGWAALRAHAAQVLAGEHADPCPTAMHWGGRRDPPRGRMRLVRCDPPTANSFYAVEGR